MIIKAQECPAWLKSGAIYQINPRTFSAEGTIASVTAELPFLASLGFKTMYLCPIFSEDDSEDTENFSDRQKRSATGNPKNPYRMKDYFEIDSEYGTMADLRAFVETSHALGMRVLLDLVYAHIGPHAAILRTHPEFAKQNADGSFLNGPWHFPLLDYDNPGLREYLWSNMAYYIAEIGVDGFRCDAADYTPIDFWVEGRRRIRTMVPDAVLLYEGGKGDALIAGFDAIYGFGWHETLYSFLRGEKTAADLRGCWEWTNQNYPSGAVIMRDIDNHDTVTDWDVRAEKLAGHAGMDLVEVLNFMIDGVPMVYCGNELGCAAHLSMFANRFHPGVFEVTDRSEAAKAADFSVRRQNLIRRLNTIRRENSAVRDGETAWLTVQTIGDCGQITAFCRKGTDSTVTVIGNLSAQPCRIRQAEEILKGNVLLESGISAEQDGIMTLDGYGYLVTETRE